MPMWMWIAIGLAAVLVLSVVVSFALAVILGAIGRGISEFYDNEILTSLPPTRSARTTDEQSRLKIEPSDPRGTKRPMSIG
jgi:hypothetical protein